MTSVPIIPESAPFTAEQRAWLNGFLAGVFGGSQLGLNSAPAPAAPRPGLLIAYGSQSGNAEALAKRTARHPDFGSFAVRVAELDAVSPQELATAGVALIISSTWGDGGMPDNAAAFWQRLNSNGSSPALAGLQFSVLALGDRNYGEAFCQAGRDLDRRLAELGGSRIRPCVECDVDFDEAAETWRRSIAEALSGAAPAPATVTTQAGDAAATAPASVWSRRNPCSAPLLSCTKLNGAGSAKDTRHVVFSIAGSGLTYEAGDALGVVPRNCPEVVNAVLRMLPFDRESPVPVPDGSRISLSEALTSGCEIRHLLAGLPEQPASPEEFVAGLRTLQPRLYSIASSPLAHPDEIHLCVGAVRYEAGGVQHKGVASTFLADRLSAGECAGVFVHSAKHFRPPADGSVPVIMIGPGTGIAPFRAFLQHREASGSNGRNWLFFGDRHSKCDYLYREEIEAWHQSGLLTRLSLAFSRDQEQKVYVQTRMRESARELWEWLEEGAHIYVCGDASRMAKDVDAALQDVIQSGGERTAEQAAEYVDALRQSKRYARDVY